MAKIGSSSSKWSGGGGGSGGSASGASTGFIQTAICTCLPGSGSVCTLANCVNLTMSTMTSFGAITGTGTGQLNGSWTYADPAIQAQLDQLTQKLELAIATMEKLVIEARYWHIRSDELEKRLAEKCSK